MIETRGVARRATAALALLLAGALSNDVHARQRPQTEGGPPVERRRGDNPRIPVTAAQAMTALSGDYRIDALLSDYQWGTTTVTYSFYSDSVFGGAYYGSETVSEVSEGVKTNVRAIMAWLGTSLNLTFVEVAETSSRVGLIRFMRSSGPAYAYAYYPSGSTMFSLTGDVHLNPAYDRLGDTNGFQHPAGEHGYVSLVHEIGHTLGLKHPHDGTPNLPSTEDTHSFTVMSYQFPGESPGTPMGYDMLALQYRYGARSYRTADDTYAFERSNIDQYRLGNQLYITPSLATKQTIWDSGGYNVLDLSAVSSTSGYRLDLRPLGWLSTAANYLTTHINAGTVLGPGVAIGKIVNSAGDDTVYASAQPNVFAGYSSSRTTGRDAVYGADAQDTLDLSGYSPGEVIEYASGSDLVIDLGANGSVTLKDYFGPNPQPQIGYSSEVPRVSISDASVSEGSSGGTSATFSVSLSAPATGDRVVSYATSDASAQAGSDYVAAAGTITFAAGETLKTVTIAINGDAIQEADETFRVTLTEANGVEILDGVGVGTILNDDLPPSTPAAPANLTAVAQYSGTGRQKVLQGIQLTWNDLSSNEDRFRIERCQVTGKGKTQSCTYPQTSAVVAANSTGHFEPASSLTRPATYRYRVRSENSIGVSAWLEVQVSVQ